jgi:hypothetical protein
MQRQIIEREVCVYGASPTAVTAALQVRRQGRSVALVAPGRHIGGMLVEGLGSQDVDNHGLSNSLAIGGLAADYFRQIGEAYSTTVQYRFESNVSERVILAWLIEAGVELFTDHQLAESRTAVMKDGARIREIEMENGTRFRARIFIDGTVEGDLMKGAGVSYTWGREANETYGETLNGIRASTTYRQFSVDVDPYVIPKVPSSGLIATIQDEPLGIPGSADRRSMGFCFRQCLTKNPSNRIPIECPVDYEPARYEIYRRYVVAGGTLFSPKENLPNDKTDLGSWHDLSGNLYGENHGYPDGTYAEREAIYAFHRRYVHGLYWFLANDPDLPPAVRSDWEPWGLAADEFTDNDGWPRSLYIRCGRRMISDYVITEADVRGKVVAGDSIGVAYWPPDMHHVRRIVKNGKAYNEGFVFGADDWTPFPISYRAITPRRVECENLLVPAALSSSYVGYGSVRLEWTMMVLGQSAGSAAVEALISNTAVQDINYSALCNQLLADGQVLDVTPMKLTHAGTGEYS